MNIISKTIINSRQNNIEISIPEEKKKNISISQGYEIQNDIFKHFSKKYSYSGWKIGCTTPVMQKYLNIPSPCLGRVMTRDVIENDTILKFDEFVQPGVECEIAVILSDKYVYSKKNNKLDEIVKRVVPSIEVVDNRWENYKHEKTSLLIADDFFASSIVFGKGSKKMKLKNLKNLKGGMKVNEQNIGKGIGSDILEDPINALNWFLNFNFSENNYPKAGDLISLGSLVQTYWVEKNDTIENDPFSSGTPFTDCKIFPTFNNTELINNNAEYYQYILEIEYSPGNDYNFISQYTKHKLEKIGLADSIRTSDTTVVFDPLEYFIPGIGSPNTFISTNSLSITVLKSFPEIGLELRYTGMFDLDEKGALHGVGLEYEIFKNTNLLIEVTKIFNNDEIQMNPFTAMKDFSRILFELKYFY